MNTVNAQYNKVLLWEKGFAKYIEGIALAGNMERPPGHITRKINDGIRMMAKADYEGMKDIVINNWMIARALKDVNLDEL